MSATAAELVVERLDKRFGAFTALAGIGLTVRPGEFLTLLGPSGSGKTTFLMILAGFEPPSAGRLLVDGADFTGVPAERRGFGMVFQGYALFPHMSVEQNLAFPLRVRRLPAAEVRRRVGAMIERVGLGEHARKRPATLSGGQQQRVALARALIPEPPVLLLDEPFSALDRNLRARMQEEVRRLHRESGTTFVFVTHDQSEALALSSRIAIFDHGRLEQLGDPREVYERPASRFVAEFLGDVNLLPLERLPVDGVAAFEGLTLATGAAANPVSRSLAIRPEHMRLEPRRPAAGNAVPVRVRGTTYLGAETRLALRTPRGTPLTISRPTASLPERLTPDTELWAAWSEGDAFFLR